MTLVGVNILPNPILDQVESRDLVAPYLGVCIDADLTRGLLSAVSDRIIANGYVTSRPYLREQDIGDGWVDISILPGVIEKIIDADSGAGNGKIATAFLFVDETLDLRQLETALEQIERPSSVTANIEIRPGSRPGGSIVAIRTVETDPLRFELGANAQTDLDDRLSFLMNWDNPFDINDIFQFRLNHGELRETFQSNRSSELSYSFALGGYLLELSHSDVEFRQRLQGGNGSFLSEGDTQADNYRVSKILARNRSHRVTLGLSLEIRDTDNFFEGEAVDVSSYRTSQIRLELLHDWYQPWGRLGMQYRFHQGLDSFGARNDDYFNRVDGAGSVARLQFEKFTLDSRITYYLDRPAWYLDLNLHVQYSDDILFDSDKLSLGGPYTVRGYSSALSGSNAWYLHSDLTWQAEAGGGSSAGGGAAKSIAFSVGLDYGETSCEIDNADVCGQIYGVGLGLLIWDRNFSGRLLWGHPLKEIGDGIGDEDRFLLDLRWAL